MTKSTFLKKVALVIALASSTIATSQTANAEGYHMGYDAHVVNVAYWDRLNMRKWPASYSHKVGSIPHDGYDVYIQRCIVKPHGSSSDWCRVKYNGQWGWVNMRYLRIM